MNNDTKRPKTACRYTVTSEAGVGKVLFMLSTPCRAEQVTAFADSLEAITISGKCFAVNYSAKPHFTDLLLVSTKAIRTIAVQKLSWV
jgi:hypothetical protein